MGESTRGSDFASTFERGRAIRTLLILFDSPEDGLDELLVRVGGSKRTAMSRVQELVRLGLAAKTVKPDVARRVIYRLTPDGRKLAEQVQKASEVFASATGQRG